jgi:hypothetical protein
MKQQRRSKRHYVRLVARLAQADGAELGSCVMTDISRTGARLSTTAASTLPEHFVLLLSAMAQVRRRCLVVWRSERAVGVEFIPDDPSPTSQGNTE